MKFQYKIVLFFVFFFPLFSLGQLTVYSANQLDSLLYAEQRPLVFFMKTDWCSICHGMEKVVWNDKEVANVLNESFYFVIFNAESKEDVVFKGKRYIYEPSGINQGKHQFAMQLAGDKGALSFPSTVILLGRDKLCHNNSFIRQKDLLYVLKTIQEAVEE